MENQSEIEEVFELAEEAYKKESYKEALKLFNKVIESVDIPNKNQKIEHIMYRSWNYIGKMYEEGNGVKQDTWKAIECYYKSNEIGRYSIAEMFRYTDLIDREGEKAIETFTKYEDWVMIGLMYRDGIGTEQNGEKAIEYFTKAEDWYLIGTMYENGDEVEQDSQKAIEYYTKAGDWHSIGNMYRYGDSIKQDGQKAIEYFTKAEDWLSIAEMYRKGIGVAKDEKKAMEYENKK